MRTTDERAGYIDIAEMRACPNCGRECIYVRQGEYDDCGPLRLEPFTARGRDGLISGYALRRYALTTHWVSYVGSVAPDDYAFPLHSCRDGERKRMTQPAQDPFATSESYPAVSFKGAPIGATVTMTVVDTPKIVQARDFDSGALEFWPDGNPKHNVVTDVEVRGERMSLWAAKPSSMFSAIANAQKAAGRLIEKGGTLVVRFVGEKPNENTRKNPQKLYEAHYTPPSAFDMAATSTPQPTPPPQTAYAQPSTFTTTTNTASGSWSVTPPQTGNPPPEHTFPEPTPAATTQPPWE